jgi:DNA-binding PadR family transcriptional regulator
MGKNYLGEFEELLLLAIINLGNETYGVPIAETIEKATGKRVSTGALYTALSRLEEKGFVRSWMGEATKERGGRAKKYFAVEGAGELALRQSEQARLKLQLKPISATF